MVTPPEEPLEKHTYRHDGRRGSFWKRSAAFATSITTAVGMMMAGGVPANADNGDHRSHARAQLLDADLLGIDLAGIGSAEQNFRDRDGDDPAVGQIDAQLVEELLNLEVGGISLPILGEGLQVGAVNSFADTPTPTYSMASSGAINENGAIDISGYGDYGYAQVDLTGALGQLGVNLDGIVDRLALELGALGSRAVIGDPEIEDGDLDRDYTLAGARLALDAPVLGEIGSSLSTTVNGTVQGLLGPEGTVQNVLNGVSTDPIGLSLLGLDVLTVDLGSPQLQAVTVELDTILEDLSRDGDIVSIDLNEGTIFVDLEALHGSGLNDLGPNTVILGDEELTQITEEVTGLVGDIVTDVTTAVESALQDTELTLTLDPQLNVLAGTVTGDIDVSINATLAELVAGSDEIGANNVQIGGGLNVDLGLLGEVNVDIDMLTGLLVNPILDDLVPLIVGPFVDNLTDVGGDLTDALNGLVTPLLDDLSPVLDVVGQVVRLTVNAQSEEGAGNLGETSSSVSALMIEVLPTLDLDIAPVTLATSTVYAEDIANYSPTLLLEPNPAQTGSEVIIGGDGYVPSSSVTVTVRDSDGNVVYENDDVQVVDDGSFQDQWTVAEDAAVGDYTVEATDNDNPEITDTETMPIYDPTVGVEPNAAKADDAVQISGDGFTAESELTIDIYDADEVQVGAVAGVSTDSEGNFTTPWTIPDNEDPGQLTVIVTDSADISADQTLDVYAPTVTPDPSSAPAEESVTLTGAGFVQDSTLTVEIAAADDVIATLEGVVVNAQGAFEELWTIPEGTEQGELTVTATDNTNELIFANASITVEEPADDDADAADTDAADTDAADSDATDAADTDAADTDADGVDADVDATDTDATDVDATDTDAVDTDATDATDADGTDADSDAVDADADAADTDAADSDATDAADTDAADTDADGVDADVDATDTDATDVDATDTDAVDTDAIDADVDTDATDATDADGTDADSDAVDADADAAGTDAADTDAADADATDADAADSDGADTDADDADATDATDGGDEGPEYSGNVSVDPSDVEAGNPVTVNGDDFAPNTVVDIVITDADGNEIATIEGVEVNDDGEFSEQWNVPADTASGTYTVSATDTENPEISGSDELSVSEAGGTDADATDADATDADAGDTDATDADADGADTDGTDAESDAVDADADATDATDTDAVDTDADATDADSTDVDGADADTDAVDADATDGDDDAGYDAEVEVNPSEVEAGGTVTIEGDDFAPGSVVDIVITDADGDEIATIENVEVNDDGDFSEQWEVPADMEPGTYTVTATDTQDEDISGSDELTVSEASAADAGATDGDDADETDPSINVDPDTAAPGEEVTIEGDDFGPEETVTIEITDEDGNVVDTITVVTDDNGDFSVTWTVPQDVAPGTLTITAADESGNSATAELTISAATVGAGGSDSGDALASTGAKATMIATAVALLLIVIGAGLLIARRNNTVNDAS